MYGSDSDNPFSPTSEADYIRRDEEMDRADRAGERVEMWDELPFVPLCPCESCRDFTGCRIRPTNVLKVRCLHYRPRCGPIEAARQETR